MCSRVLFFFYRHKNGMRNFSRSTSVNYYAIQKRYQICFLVREYFIRFVFLSSILQHCTFHRNNNNKSPLSILLCGNTCTVSYKESAFNRIECLKQFSRLEFICNSKLENITVVLNYYILFIFQTDKYIELCELLKLHSCILHWTVPTSKHLMCILF